MRFQPISFLFILVSCIKRIMISNDIESQIRSLLCLKFLLLLRNDFCVKSYLYLIAKITKIQTFNTMKYGLKHNLRSHKFEIKFHRTLNIFLFKTYFYQHLLSCRQFCPCFFLMNEIVFNKVQNFCILCQTILFALEQDGKLLQFNLT